MLDFMETLLCFFTYLKEGQSITANQVLKELHTETNMLFFRWCMTIVISEFLTIKNKHKLHAVPLENDQNVYQLVFTIL